MIAFISLIYASFYFLVFGKGLIKTNARNVSIFVGVGVVLVGVNRESIEQRIPAPVDLEQLVPLHLDAMVRALSSGGTS